MMDDILEALQRLKDEWQNRTRFKQDALEWAIKERKIELEKSQEMGE